MNSPKDIVIAEYDYPLPEERIAKFPLEKRDQSKLLVCQGETIQESTFAHIADFLPSDTLLVFNNTKVIHARLFFRKPTGSTIEIFCLEPWHQPVAAAFEERAHCTWTCFVGNNKKWKAEPLSRTLTVNGTEVVLTATRREPVGDSWRVDFDWTGGCCYADIIEHAGVIPLPPYLNREAVSSDNERYQTIYARHEGSVAAPTAGLHFTDEVFERLRNRDVATEFITLHVGAGTFKPVSSDTIGEHEMHVEKIQVSRANLEHIVAHQGRPLVAVGTTTVRTLESLYWFGVKLDRQPGLDAMHICQWDPYQLEGEAVDALQSYRNVLQWMERHGVDILDGETQLMIAPGYRYHVVNGIITNFHQPKSTLLLLVSAFIGEQWKECYRYALDHHFRFLSYGDSCLFLTNP